MRKTVLAILGTLLISGSMVQMTAAAERHVPKAYRAQLSASQHFGNANNSDRVDVPRNGNFDFDRRNTFN